VNKPLHVVSVVGARPQFVKLAPIARAFGVVGGVRHTIVHTGQHYDDNMSSVFFDELEIPRPDLNLDIGSSGHAAQTGQMMVELENCFQSSNPDVVLVYGDTNSTLAACLASAKIHIPVAHIEAGLRSFNRKMPEEINRVATDHCSDRLYVPTDAGMENLTKENLASRSVLSGDVMRDAVLHSIRLAEVRDKPPVVPDSFAISDGYGVLTLHRASNTESNVLIPLLQSLDKIAQQFLPLIFPVHPRTRGIIESADIALSDRISLIEPLPYLDMLQTVKNAGMVLTDSGGLQKEAAFLGTQCVTLREETEWTETLEIGVNQLVGTDISKVERAVQKVAAAQYSINQNAMSELDSAFGDGNAAKKIVEDIVAYFGQWQEQ